MKTKTKSLRPVTPNSILASKLADLVASLGPDDLSEEQRAELDLCRRLSAGMETYLEAVSTAPSQSLDDLDAHTQSIDWDAAFASGETTLALESEMLSGRLEGQFLRFLVAALQSKTILEIGMFTGYSALAMAEGMGRDGHLYACEYDAFAAAQARELFDQSGCGERITIEVGPALETMARYAEEKKSFDFIFLDADKAGYIDYCKLILDRGLLEHDGVLAIDNTLLQGEPYAKEAAHRSSFGEAIREFNAWIAGDERVEQVLVPVRDGVTLVRQVASR